MFLIDLCAPSFHQASKSKNSQWDCKVNNKNWSVTDSLQRENRAHSKSCKKKRGMGSIVDSSTSTTISS